MRPRAGNTSHVTNVELESLKREVLFTQVVLKKGLKREPSLWRTPRRTTETTEHNFCLLQNILLTDYSSLVRLINTAPEPTWSQLGHKGSEQDHNKSAHTDNCSSVRGDTDSCDVCLMMYYQVSLYSCQCHTGVRYIHLCVDTFYRSTASHLINLIIRIWSVCLCFCFFFCFFFLFFKSDCL